MSNKHVQQQRKQHIDTANNQDLSKLMQETKDNIQKIPDHNIKKQAEEIYSNINDIYENNKENKYDNMVNALNKLKAVSNQPYAVQLVHDAQDFLNDNQKSSKMHNLSKTIKNFATSILEKRDINNNNHNRS